MILLDTDISFCMVCKLWYISIRCIFKNLVLKLRIYNFRGVLCMQLSASPAIILPKTFPSYPSIFLSFPLFMCLPECLRLCLLSTFSLLFLQLLITFYIYFYTLYIAFLFYGSYISIVFKNGSMVLQRTMYDPFLRAILIPKCTYFHP